MNATTAQGVVIAVIVIAVVIATARLQMFCLRELAHTPDVELQYLSRSAWTAAVPLLIPVGVIAYLYYGRAW